MTIGSQATGYGLRVTAGRGARASNVLAVSRSLLAVGCLATFSAHAEKTFAVPKAAEGINASPAGGAASVMLALLLVLAAIFAAAWVMRRLRAGTEATRGAMEVLADLPLGTKERAVLVRVGKEQLLLGVAPGRVNTLHVFPEGQGPVIPGERTETGGDLAKPDFKAILRRSVGL
ncbi:MAG: flagellar biosynthetic protein FliO [Steroidobacteraceae bacterium]